jgi:hypothetical protein
VESTEVVRTLCALWCINHTHHVHATSSWTDSTKHALWVKRCVVGLLKYSQKPEASIPHYSFLPCRVRTLHRGDILL